MKLRYPLWSLAVFGALTAFLPATARAQAEDQAPAIAAEDGVEVLSRGPMHEAFAQPGLYKAEATAIVNKEPPAPIEELPPDVKPEGDAVWIPGYWFWDADRGDFVWLSGAWRVVPPDQRWVPGYWAQAEGGYQWVSGFWDSQEAKEVAYLPEAPPETLEQGPSSPAPSEEYFWAPGYWNYHQTRYVWRPGYWGRVQPDWVWVPPRYCWTPTGYVFVNGFWDYPVARRGWLFAPVYFSRHVYSRPNYVYTPSVVLNTSLISLQLFAQPRWGCYFYGDYYAPRYRQAGFYPWFEYGRIGYDPIYHYQRWQYGRRDPHWVTDVRRGFDSRGRGQNAPPSRFLREQGFTDARLSVPLRQYVARDGVRQHIERLEDSRRQEARQVARGVRQLQTDRQRTELRTIAGTAGGRTRVDVNTRQKVTLRLPEVQRTPRSAGQVSRQDRPPSRGPEQAGRDVGERRGDGTGRSAVTGRSDRDTRDALRRSAGDQRNPQGEAGKTDARGERAPREGRTGRPATGLTDTPRVQQGGQRVPRPTDGTLQLNPPAGDAVKQPRQRDPDRTQRTANPDARAQERIQRAKTPDARTLRQTQPQTNPDTRALQRSQQQQQSGAARSTPQRTPDLRGLQRNPTRPQQTPRVEADRNHGARLESQRQKIAADAGRQQAIQGARREAQARESRQAAPHKALRPEQTPARAPNIDRGARIRSDAGNAAAARANRTPPKAQPAPRPANPSASGGGGEKNRDRKERRP